MPGIVQKLAMVPAVGLVALALTMTSCSAWPSAPSCGSPRSDHSAPIESDSAVSCFRHAAASCTSMELDINGLMNDNSVDQHLIVAPDDHCRIDDYITHYFSNIPSTALDWRCTAFVEVPNWGLVLAGCDPAVQCYDVIDAPVIDPPAVASSPAPGATPTATASPSPIPAGPGSPAVAGRPHC